MLYDDAFRLQTDASLLSIRSIKPIELPKDLKLERAGKSSGKEGRAQKPVVKQKKLKVVIKPTRAMKPENVPSVKITLAREEKAKKRAISNSKGRKTKPKKVPKMIVEPEK